MAFKKTCKLMKDYLKSKHVWYIGTISVLISLLIFTKTSFFSTELIIEFESSRKGNLQIYYSNGHGFTEADSYSVPIQILGKYDTYIIKLTDNNIHDIRIDPTGDFRIKSVKFSNGKQTYKLAGEELLKNIKPLHDIKSLYFKNNQVVGIVSGSDPYFIFKKLPILNDSKGITINQIVLFLLIFSILFLLFYILWEYWLKYDYETNIQPAKTISLSGTLFLSLLSVIFLWFLYQTVYFATNIEQGIAPDEIYHILLSKFQSESFTLYNHDTPESYILGAISVRPYLYHFIMGKLLMLNVWGFQDFIYLRILNIVLGLFTLYFTLLLAKEVTANKWIQLAALVIQSNILMYVFISSMVSYDNLINLISTASFVLLIRFLKYYKRKDFILLLISMALGALTKITYGPVIVIQIGILLFYTRSIYNNRSKLLSKSFSVKEIFLVSILAALFALNLHLYINNLVDYGQIQPRTAKVFGHEKAYQVYDQYKRDYDLKMKVNSKTLMPFHTFLLKYLKKTGSTMFGIGGHKTLLRPLSKLIPYGVIGLLSFFIYLIRYKNKNDYSTLKIILISIISYAIAILLINYYSYKSLGLFGLALQGRYNFPVLALANVFIAYNIFSIFKDRTKIVLLVLFAVFLSYNSFFWSVSHFTTDWYLN